MAWIESHVDLGDHPKITELCFNLMIKKYEAIGHLTLLWHFTMKYAWRDGDLRRFTARAICQAAGWDKDEETFIRALQTVGWLEKDKLRVHDWLDYAGKLVRDRRYNEERRKTALNGVNPRKSTATLPYPTLPDPTKDNTIVVPTPKDGDGPTAEDLVNLWNETAHPSLPKVQILTEGRKRKAKARLVEHPEAVFWSDLVLKVNRSPLLTGQIGKWRCSFDWILEPNNLAKIVEGNYDAEIRR